MLPIYLYIPTPLGLTLREMQDGINARLFTIRYLNLLTRAFKRIVVDSWVAGLSKGSRVFHEVRVVAQ